MKTCSRLPGLSGDEITVDIRGTGFTADLTIFGPSGYETGTGTSDTHLSMTLPSDGDYSIVVRGSGAASLGNGPYLLSVSDPQPVVSTDITFGERASGEVHVPGDYSEFNLAVGAGDVGKAVSIVHSAVSGYSSSNYDPVLELYGPDGSLLASQQSSYYSYAAEIDDFVLLVEGTYTIRAYEYFDTYTGSFTIGVSDQPISLPRTLPGFDTIVTGTLDPMADVDDYTFAGSAGEIITVQLLTGSYFDLTLFDAAGSEVAGSGTSDSLLDFITLPSDGTYTLRLEPAGGTVYPYLDDTGDYSFVVWKPTREPTPIPITFGESQPGQVAIPGDNVDFSLEVTGAEVGQPVSIVHSAVSNYSSSAYDPVLELYGPDGSLLASQRSTSYNNAAEIDDFVLPVEGTYTIRAYEYYHTYTGSFSIGVSDQPITSAWPLPAFDTTITGAIASVGDVDDYTFTGSAGEVITVERLTGSYFDLTLFDATGSVVAGSGINDALLEFVTLPDDGMYTLRIEPVGGTVHSYLDEVGDYSFAVWKPTRTPTPIPITFGDSQPGQVAVRGDIVDFSLEVTAAEVGRPVSIVHSQTSGYYYSMLELYGPDGSLLASQGPTNAYSYASEIDDFVLPAEGTYIIRSYDYYNSYTANFTIGVSDQPTESPVLIDIGSKTAGALEVFGDVDEFLVTATSNDSISLYVTAGTGLDTDLTVFDSGSGEVGRSTSGVHSSLTFTPVSGETYTLRIEPGGGTSGANLDGRGVYLLEISDATHPATYADEGSVVSLGQGIWYAATIGSSSDVDAFTFNGTAGQLVRVAVGTGYDHSNLLRADVNVYAPNGVLLTSSSTSTEVDFKDFGLPNVDGEYRIEVSGRADDVGPYIIGVSDRFAEESTAIPLTNGESHGGSLEFVSDEDVFTFSYTEGDIISLSASSLDTAVSLEMLVYSPIGSLIHTRTGAVATLAETTLPGEGDFTVLLRSSTRTTTDYVVSYLSRPAGTDPPPSSLPGEPAEPIVGPTFLDPRQIDTVAGEPLTIVPPLPSDAPGYDNLGTIPLDFGEILVQQFPSGQGEVTFELAVTSGETLDILVEATEHFDAALELYNPAGTLIALSTDGPNPSVTGLLATATGTYQAVVRGNGEGGFATGAWKRGLETVVEVTLDSAPIVSVFDSFVQQQQFHFAITVPEPVSLQIVPFSGTFLDTHLELIGTFGQIIAAASAGSTSALTDVRLLAVGDYTFNIRPEYPLGGLGGYSVKLTRGSTTAITPALHTEIGFGATAAGAIASAGDDFLLSLVVTSAEVGQPVSIVHSAVSGHSSSNYDPVLELYGPDGSLLASQRSSYYSYAAEIDDFVLPVEGTYTIRAYEYFDTYTGSFTIGVSDQPITSPTPLTDFDTTVTGTLDPMADVDDYTFAGSAGEIITVQLLTGSYFDLTLFDAAGSEVAGSGTSDSLLDFITLPSDGTYTLRLEPAGGTVYPYLDDTGDYSFVVWKPTREPTPIPITFGESQPGQVAIPGDIVDFSLEVTSAEVGQPVSIVHSAVSNYSSSAYDPVLELYGPDGSLLASQRSTSYNNAAEIDDFILPVEGTYTIRAYEYYHTYTGSFSIGVSDQPVSSPTPLPDFDTTVTDTIDPMGDVDDYTFTGSAGEVITVERLTGSYFDLTLFDATGSVVAGSGINDALLEFVTLPDDGMYTLRIEPVGGTVHSYLDEVGDYSFAVWKPTRTPTPIPITFGDSQPGQVAVRGDIVDFSLEVTAAEVGRPVSIVHSQTSGYYYSMLELYGPDGSLLASQGPTNAYSYASEIDDFVLPAEGTYIIRSYDYYNSYTASFTIGVSDQPVTSPTPLPDFDTTVTDAIESLGDVDDYTFAGTVGEVVTVERLTGSYFDLTLFDATGAVLAGGGNSDSLLELITLPTDGTYTLRIEPAGGVASSSLDETGDYSFVVWKPTRAPTLIPITFGENQPGQGVVRGDVVDFSLEVTAAEVGRPVSIVHSQTAGYYYSMLELYGPGGSLLASQGPTNAYSYASEIDDFVLPVVGTYIIRSSDYYNSYTASFTIGVSDQPIAQGTEFMPVNSRMRARDISPLGDADQYEFSAPFGKTVDIEVDAITNGLDLDITVLDSFGHVAR